MSRRHLPIQQIILATLALWLGLWPAADAVTGTSQVVVAVPMPPAPVASCAATECVLVEAATLSCCQMTTSPEAPESPCCGKQMEQCARCFCLGGVVLFAVNQWTLEPDLAVRGTIAAATETGTSRTLQPPVPPPLAIS